MSDVDGEKKVVGRTWADVAAELFSGAPAWIISAALAGFVGVFAYTAFFLDECRTLAILGKAGPCDNGPSNYGSLPEGAVVAFVSSETEPCPSDEWSIYDEAKGRFIIGAGHDRQNGLTFRSLGETGGAETHTLETHEMPEHNHFISTGFKQGGNWHDGLAGVTEGDVGVSRQATGIDHKFMDDTTGVLRDGGHGILTGVISNAGEDVGHNNMPPFIALYYCKKK